MRPRVRMNRRPAPAQHPGVKPGPSYLVFDPQSYPANPWRSCQQSARVRYVLSEAADAISAERAASRKKSARAYAGSSSRWNAAAVRRLRFADASPRRGDAHCPVDEALTGRRARGPPCGLVPQFRDRRSSLTSLHDRFEDRPHAGVVSCNAPSHSMSARIGIRRERRYLRTLRSRCQLLLRKLSRSRAQVYRIRASGGKAGKPCASPCRMRVS